MMDLWLFSGTKLRTKFDTIFFTKKEKKLDDNDLIELIQNISN